MVRQITCTSFRKPSGKSGRIGRSIRRDVRVSFFTGAPSRLKYPPGIRPPAYARSRYSTVSGKKSCASLALLAATQVASTIEPPNRTTTAPSACLATLPVSMVIRNPLLSTSTVWVIRRIVLAYRPESGERRVERALRQPARGPPDSFRPRTDQCEVTPPSTADAELVYDGAVPFRRPGPEVLEKTATLADQHQQPAARVVVLRVLLDMVRQAVDPLGEERDLYFGRARVALVGTKLLDQILLPFDGKRHRRPPIATPQGAVLPRRGGFQKLFFCQEIRPEGTTRSYRSKANGWLRSLRAPQRRRARSAAARRRRWETSAPPGGGGGRSGSLARRRDHP